MSSKVQPEFTPEQFEEAQRKLGLSDAQMAALLGFENSQHIRRLRAPSDAAHAKRVMPYTARLLRAYLDGYRPEDWPVPTDGTVKEDGGLQAAIERIKTLEDAVSRIVGKHPKDD